MKKVLVCGMLLGLLTSVSFAQRGRAIGGVGTSARIPNVGPVSPTARINPNSINTGHDGVLPNATTGKNPKPLTPNATTDPTAKTVGPDAKTIGPNTVTTVPDRVITSDANTGPGPDR
ncbi:MAG: hypothetical protein ABSE85_12755 [Candidatus Korobacteraceae bacterium]|jgi:hypothetical protein